MAGRPPNPVIVTGTAYVWFASEIEGVARRQRAVTLASRALASGHTAFALDESTVELFGVLVAQAVDGEVAVHNLSHTELGPPVFATFAIAAEGRVPGLPCTIGLFAETSRNKRWLAPFGRPELEPWLKRFNLPGTISQQPGAIRFTTRENRDTVRHELWKLLRGGAS